MQLELDLDDRCQQLDFILKNTSTGGGGWRVYKVTKMSGFVYALGIRTPDPAGQADHNYIETINREEAEWLIAERGISKGIGFE
jgi:hypothetical protein